ncbi:MAG: hypothetical protein ABEK59_11025 [Halobacteria archaeon]
MNIKNPNDHLKCPICDGRMVHHHCEYRCTNCGYLRDCSDPDR